MYHFLPYLEGREQAPDPSFPPWEQRRGRAVSAGIVREGRSWLGCSGKVFWKERFALGFEGCVTVSSSEKEAASQKSNRVAREQPLPWMGQVEGHGKPRRTSCRTFFSLPVTSLWVQVESRGSCFHTNCTSTAKLWPRLPLHLPMLFLQVSDVNA